MREQCFVQAENYSNRSYFPVLKEGFTFNKVSLRIIFKNFGGGGGVSEKNQIQTQFSETKI